MSASYLPGHSPAANLGRTNWLDTSDSPSLLNRPANASNPILAESCGGGPEIRRENQRSSIATQHSLSVVGRTVASRFPDPHVLPQLLTRLLRRLYLKLEGNCRTTLTSDLFSIRD